MEVDVNNKSKAKIDEEEIISLVNFFVKLYQISDREISIAIVGDTVMRRLNREYRGIDASTDILSFDGEDGFLGELIINYSQIKRQTPYFSKNVNEEFLFIVIHGLLHLLGFDDAEEADRIIMINKGKGILKEFLNNLN